MIDILRAGLLTSVQDLGRRGYRHLGIGLCGALDPLALSIANRLVGNEPGAAGLEITMGPCSLRFTCDTRVALSGADCHADLQGTPVAAWWSFPVKSGQVLTLRTARLGMRAYVAVAGGIAVPDALGSRSTDLIAGFGGHKGRALRDGDRLPTGTPAPGTNLSAPAFGVKPPVWRVNPQTTVIRVMPGPEYDDFTVASHHTFWNADWTVTPNSNRMGYRLAGPELQRKKNRSHDLLSHGVVPGVIQVPPSGQPIVLLADAQTTGGYPKIGTAIGADIWKLAQVRLGASLRFAYCSLDQAHQALHETTRYAAQIEQALVWHHEGFLNNAPRAARTL